MNDQGLQTAQQNAQNAAKSASDLSTSAPDLLNQLKQNLVGIFADNNPIVTARNGALSDYLSENAKSRAAQLPQNVGDVPGYTGRPLTFSPTEQDAMTTSRNAAALAPLTGYNAILQSMFGQIPDMVKSAGDIYGAHIKAATDAATMAEQNYQDSIAQYNAEKKASSSGDLLNDPTIQAILAAIMGGGANTGQASGSTRPPLDSFVTQPKSLSDTISGLQMPTNSYLPSNTSASSATLSPVKKAAQPKATPMYPLNTAGPYKPLNPLGGYITL